MNLMPTANNRQPETRPVFPSWIRRAIILTVALLLGLAFSLGVSSPAEAGWTDWFSSSDQPPQKPRTVKKAGLKTTQPGKKQSATSKVFGQLAGNPKNFVAGTKSLFGADKPVSHSASRTVPRKMVADKQPKPSMLKRLFTPTPPAQPRTVTEWMAQKRPE
jgi:hypothetical protein